jgi:hypothetical protein
MSNLVVSSSLCEGIATQRRKLRKITKANVLFLDETHIRLSEAAQTTVVLPGEKPYVVVEETTTYAKRYDMIACCTGQEVLPPIIFSPSDREMIRTRGVNTKMLIKYIQDILAQACGALDRWPLILVLDKASIHNEAEIMEAFRDNGCQDLAFIMKMPTQAGKRMSPVDNSLFHEWKERVRTHNPLTDRNIVQIMSDEWNSLPKRHLAAYYQHCGLTTLKLPYFDCPQPLAHKHKSPRHGR